MHTDIVEDKLKYKELTGEIIKAAFEVQNNLGCGFLERVYENALFQELKNCGLKAEKQKNLKVNYKGVEVGTYICDLLVEDKIIVEVKIADQILGIYQAQLMNYLKISGYRVGLILNFSKPRLEYKRIIV